MSRISIIGVPMDLGADRRGVDMGPSALRYADLNEKLKELEHDVEDLGDLDVIIPETRHFGDPQAKYLREIADACTHLAQTVLTGLRRRTHAARAGRRSLHRGGHRVGHVRRISARAQATRPDMVRCACGFQHSGNFPERQRARHADGVLLGYGPKELTHIFDFAPKIQPQHAVMIGIREVDPRERELVKKSGIRVFTMKEIDRRGIGTVLDEAISIVTNGTDGFAATLDADFLDPYESPGVATPVRGGADYREAHLAMEMIADTKKMVSFEITEINPILDVHNKTAHFGMELILSAFGKQIL